MFQFIEDIFSITNLAFSKRARIAGLRSVKKKFLSTGYTLTTNFTISSNAVSRNNYKYYQENKSVLNSFSVLTPKNFSTSKEHGLYNSATNTSKILISH